MSERDGGVEEKWHDLAETIFQTIQEIMESGPIVTGSEKSLNPKIVAMLITSRSLANFRGVQVLIYNRLIIEARTLVRSCYENSFFLGGILKDGPAFVTQMLEDDARSTKVRTELILSQNFELLSEVEDAIKNKIRSINKIWPKPSFLNISSVAKGGPLNNAYLIYSQLSSDSAHPTITSIHRHLGNQQTINVSPIPTDTEIIQTRDWSCNAMLGIAGAINEILGNTNAGWKLNHIVERYNSLAKIRSVPNQ
jgi:Family of unknown function (DUF5677)